MASKKKTRGKGEGGLYKNSNGLWTAVVELPSHDGKRRRRVVRSADKKIAAEKLAAIKAELRGRGDLPSADQTVAQWVEYWFTEIAAKEIRPKTAAGYGSVIKNHIIPVIGQVRLEKVTAAHIRRVTDRITGELGLSSTYALNAHRILSTIFASALREGRIGRNPATLTKAPRKAIADLNAMTLDEALRLMEVMSTPEHAVLGARWITSLLTGGRRSEIIGLERDRVGGVIDLSWQLQRITWKHGCITPCGKIRGTDCPSRRLIMPADYEVRPVKGGLYWTRPKSTAGWRVIPLVEPLRSILERFMEATPPNEFGLLFTNASGNPIDPDQDSRAWHHAREAAGITKNVRLHDVRHTTVDLLLEAGVPEDVVMEIVGHSSRAVTRGYKFRGETPRLRSSMEQFSLLFTQPNDGNSGILALDAS